ncbi:MAG: hypothetical protein BGO92_01195 [Magnetospirillum sp. 64-120]|nr:MAG: hypothetical protein BGO92_01195 [Magnetospirillum sp. 64-120]
MLIHGLVAAAIIGGTATVYSQITDNGASSAQVAQTEAVGQSNAVPTLLAGNDDVRPVRSDRHRDRHDRKHDHDDDDD